MAISHAQTCPHCGTVNVGFTFTGEAQIPGFNGLGWHTYFMCNTCTKPLVVLITSAGSARPSTRDGDLKLMAGLSGLKIESVYPVPRAPNTPAHCPPKVAQAFNEAESAIHVGNLDSAIAMDRRALELATKLLAPEKADDSLYRRIEHLAKEFKLTPALQEWAHSLRLVGNQAVHEIDGVSKAEAMQAHELTRYILIYLFTLPTQVQLAREAEKASK
jgi:hypothetical protein